MPMYIDVTTAAAETVAHVLAQRQGAAASRPYTVTVTTQGGATASVLWGHQHWGVTLNLPTLPSDAWLSRAEADRITGFVIHEACHVLHSSLDYWKLAVKAGPRVQLWTNSLEDVRIEALEIAAGKYPAMRTLLQNVLDNLHTKAVKASKGPIGGNSFDAAPYVACVLGRMRNGYVVPSARKLEAGLSKATRKLVRHALARLPECKSTADVLKLAKALVAMEQRMAAKPKPEQPKPNQPKQNQPKQDQPKQGQGDEGQGDEGQGDEGQGDEGQGDEGQGDEGQGDEGQGDEGQGDEGQGDEGQGDEDQGQGQGDQGTKDQGRGQGQGDQGTKDQGSDHGDGTSPAPSAELGDMTELTAEVAKANDVEPGEAGSRTLHGWRVERDRQVEARGDPIHEPETRAALRGLVPNRAVLHQEIARMLVSEEQRQVTHHETSGRLDRRALSRMRAGAVDVFTRKHETPGVDTALGVLWDLSSSMQGARTVCAAATVLQLAEAAEDANARFGCYGFRMPTWEGPNNITTGQLVPIWAWGQRPALPARTLASVTARGSTRLAPCILAMASDMLEQPAARRILLVLTDGECDYGPTLTKEACRLAQSWGVSVIGLGILSPDAIQAFPDKRSVNVNNLADLGRIGLRTLADVLEAEQD